MLAGDKGGEDNEDNGHAVVRELEEGDVGKNAERSEVCEGARSRGTAKASHGRGEKVERYRAESVGSNIFVEEKVSLSDDNL